MYVHVCVLVGIDLESGTLYMLGKRSTAELPSHLPYFETVSLNHSNRLRIHSVALSLPGSWDDFHLFISDKTEAR